MRLAYLGTPVLKEQNLLSEHPYLILLSYLISHYLLQPSGTLGTIFKTMNFFCMQGINPGINHPGE